MLNSVSQLQGSSIVATDGEIGRVEEAYFDDQAWAIRYLVVDTGEWLSGREVLISPYAVVQPLRGGKSVDVALTRAQVQASPDIDTHRPVSRRHEQEYLRYYAYPNYWQGDSLWNLGALPLLAPALPAVGEPAPADAVVPEDDVHLRSSAAVTGYDIQASDGSIGHVSDFLFEDDSWAIRYLVVDTRNWWPGGKRVLLATRWIDGIDWAEKSVATSLTREQVKNAPQYEEGVPLAREDEERLHAAYGRKGYWD